MDIRFFRFLFCDVFYAVFYGADVFYDVLFYADDVFCVFFFSLYIILIIIFYDACGAGGGGGDVFCVVFYDVYDVYFFRQNIVKGCIFPFSTKAFSLVPLLCYRWHCFFFHPMRPLSHYFRHFFLVQCLLPPRMTPWLPP